MAYYSQSMERSMVCNSGKITELNKRWYDVVSKDHFKDCDAYFYITKGWNYDEPSGWLIEHSAYIGCGPDGITYDTLEQAEEALIEYLEALLLEYEEV